MTCTTEVEDIHVELELSINLYKNVGVELKNGGIRSMKCSIFSFVIYFVLYLGINLLLATCHTPIRSS